MRGAAETKKLIRASKRAWLQRLPRQEGLERSQRIVSNLKRVQEFLGAGDVLLCLSFGNEPNTWGLMQELIRSPDKKLYLPRSDPRNGCLHVHPYPCVLRKSKTGLHEPSPDAEEIAPEQVNSIIDLALVLGIAFERHRGYRIGHGKGYFDRFLEDKSFTTIGLALEGQLLEELPSEPHDVPMRILVTENRIYRY